MTAPPFAPFSQRNGLAPIPPQLKLNEVSQELRRLLHYAILQDLEAGTGSGYSDPYLKDRWKVLARDMWVRVQRQDPDTFSADLTRVRSSIKSALLTPLPALFDFVEFLVRHPNFAEKSKAEVAQAFVDARVAYRVVDAVIVAIGTEEQAAAFVTAIADAETKDVAGARRHLIQAGVALRKGDWASSVRESIHAVESVAVVLAPNEKTLGAALKEIERNGYLHGSLKGAFSQLYGYTNDEKGVRHALAFNDEAKVDETDALFMLGACASFVSYLLSRIPRLHVDSGSV